jgi:hypothetical protein
MRCRQSLARDRAPDAESAPRLAHLRCSLPQEALVRGQQSVLPWGLVDRPASISVDTAPYRSHFEARCMGNTSRRMLELSFATSPLRISCGVTSGWL